MLCFYKKKFLFVWRASHITGFIVQRKYHTWHFKEPVTFRELAIARGQK